MANQFYKVRFILTKKLKKELSVIAILTFIGMMFEMVGVGVFIPVFGILVNPNYVSKYQSFKTIFDFLGKPTHIQLSVYVLLLLVVFYIIKTFFLIFISIRQSKFIAELNVQVLNEMFEGYINQPYLFHIQNNSSKLIRNLQTEIAQFSSLSQAYLSLALEVSVVIGISLLLVLANPIASISIFLFLSISVYLFQKITKKHLQIWGKIRQDKGELVNKHIFQGLGGIKEIILSGKSSYFAKQVYTNSKESSSVTIKYLTLSSVPRFFLEFITVLGLALFCLLILFQGNQIGEYAPVIGVFAAAAFRLMPSIGKIMNSLQVIKYFQPVIDLLYEEFNLIRKKISTNTKEQNNFVFEEKLELRSVDFKYPNSNKNTLENINIKIKKGETIGIIGKSGGGKSTLINIITGLIQSDSGSILIDGKEVDTKSLNWHSKIGYVPQNIYLLDDTIANNIAFGLEESKINNSAIKEAIISANLEDLIFSMPKGTNSIVGERGVNLSGGQIQRIGIARAMYNNPEILIFDEATSALDSINENAIMNSINKLKRKKTIIIISHRISTLAQCDTIYEMEDGALTEKNIIK